MEKNLWKHLPKNNSTIARVLYDYYWMHRNCRVSKLHKKCGLAFKELDEIGQGIREASKEDLLKVADALQKVLKEFTTRITAYNKELLNEINREYGQSQGSH